MIYWLGILIAGIFIFLSALHIYWLLGGNWGNSGTIPVVNGKRLINPKSHLTILVAAALLTAAMIVLGRIGYFGSTMPRWLFTIGTIGISATFFLRSIGDFNAVGFFKRVNDTEFAYWDTRLYSPLCLFISCSALAIGLFA